MAMISHLQETVSRDEGVLAAAVASKRGVTVHCRSYPSTDLSVQGEPSHGAVRAFGDYTRHNTRPFQLDRAMRPGEGRGVCIGATQVQGGLRACRTGSLRRPARSSCVEQTLIVSECVAFGASMTRLALAHSHVRHLEHPFGAW